MHALHPSPAAPLPLRAGTACKEPGLVLPGATQAQHPAGLLRANGNRPQREAQTPAMLKGRWVKRNADPTRAGADGLASALQQGGGGPGSPRAVCSAQAAAPTLGLGLGGVAEGRHLPSQTGSPQLGRCSPQGAGFGKQPCPQQACRILQSCASVGLEEDPSWGSSCRGDARGADTPREGLEGRGHSPAPHRAQRGSEQLPGLLPGSPRRLRTRRSRQQP